MNLKIDSENITGILMVGHFGNRDCQINNSLVAATRVIFQFQSGKSTVYQFKNATDMSVQFIVYKLLHENNGIPEHAFTDYGQKIPNTVWAEYPEIFYSSEENHFYTKLHTIIADKMINSINENPILLEQIKQEGVQLISLGCRNADDLFCSYQALSKNGWKCEAIGLDINQDNINKATKKYQTYPFIFKKMNVLSVNRLINDVNFNNKKVKIFISSGLFTRQVLEGAYQVAQVLQQLKYLIDPHLIFIAGLKKVMLTADIVNSIGFDVSVTNQLWNLTDKNNFHNYIEFFVIKKNTIQQQLSYQRHRSFYILDLTLTANPVQLCQALSIERKHSTVRLDISWCYLQDKNIPDLLEEIQKFPNLLSITLSCHEPWAKSFIQEMKSLGFYAIDQRIDCINSDELPPISVSQAIQLKIYLTPPTVALFKPYKLDKKMTIENTQMVDFLAHKTHLSFFTVRDQDYYVDAITKVDGANSNIINKIHKYFNSEETSYFKYNGETMFAIHKLNVHTGTKNNQPSIKEKLISPSFDECMNQLKK